MYINTTILVLKRLWEKMRAKIETSLEKPKSKIPRLLGNLREKIGRSNLVRFSANDNVLSTLELNHHQTHIKSTTCTEIERQQINGLIYANIVRFR